MSKSVFVRIPRIKTEWSLPHELMTCPLRDCLGALADSFVSSLLVIGLRGFNVWVVTFCSPFPNELQSFYLIWLWLKRAFWKSIDNKGQLSSWDDLPLLVDELAISKDTLRLHRFTSGSHLSLRLPTSIIATGFFLKESSSA